MRIYKIFTRLSILIGLFYNMNLLKQLLNGFFEVGDLLIPGYQFAGSVQQKIGGQFLDIERTN